MSWPPGDDDYKRAWQDWVRRRTQSLVATISWLGLLVLPGLRLVWLAGRTDAADFSVSPVTERIWEMLFGIAFIASTVTGMRAMYWRCPRCNNPFGQRSWWFRSESMFACAHCGLRRDYVKAVYEGKVHVDTTDY